MKYDFAFSWTSTYGFAARLAAQHASRGLVVDLGCGAAAFAQPMTELGFDYVGFEVDDESVELCRSRGIACETIDLTQLESAIERVVDVVGDRSVTVISLLDVIEHLVEPELLVQALAVLVDRLASGGRPTPLLVVSIPNVAHIDLGAKLVSGRWDVTETGLLDKTHVTLFTERRVSEVIGGGGFVEVGRNDVVIARSEQQFPVDHPAIAPVTPTAMFLRALRDGADDYGDTYQFVRCYGRVADAVEPVEESSSDTEPFLTVVVVWAGEGIDLVDVLTCLAAQTNRDIEVLVAVAGASPSAAAAVVELFAEEFVRRVRVIEPGHTASATERALDQARGRYVSVVPDDRVLGANWVAEFRTGADEAAGRIVRCGATVQQHERESSNGRRLAVSELETASSDDFDLVEHLRANRTPLGSYAVPRVAIEVIRPGFDGTDPDASSWEFLVRLASRTGVISRPVVTSGCRSLLNPADTEAVGEATRARLVEALDASPLLLPAGSVRRLLLLLDDVDEQQRHSSQVLERIAALERSRYWRVTAPLRWITSRRGWLAERVGGRQ